MEILLTVGAAALIAYAVVTVLLQAMELLGLIYRPQDEHDGLDRETWDTLRARALADGQGRERQRASVAALEGRRRTPRS